MMAFELIGARLLAPTIGSSTYVWTSVIGVIIAALSTGYFLGGKLADKRNEVKDVVFLCLAIAMTIGVMLEFFDPVMSVVVDGFQDQRFRGVVASLTLFAPTSLLLGMLSPYLVKLNVTSLATSGRSVANLSAMNSIGGIAGTFVTGFIIFSYMGSRQALAVIALLAVLASWLFIPRIMTRPRVALSAVALVVVILPLFDARGTVRIDTPSSHYEIITTSGAQPLRYLLTGPNGAQSGVFVNRPDTLAFWYTKEIARQVEESPAKSSILILGGGAFTLPHYFAKTYPNRQIDVVEIDPDLADIAMRYFNYDNQKNVRVIDDDARAYVNKTSSRYDIVIVDVYSDTSVPFSLLTQEFGEAIGRLTRPSGTVLVNAIAAQTGACKPMLQAIDQTYRSAAQYAWIARAPGTNVEDRANLILTYAKQKRAVEGAEVFSKLSGPQYGDNFMPAERLQQQCQSAS
jgi:predicted membrane-bound spermidine synthase